MHKFCEFLLISISPRCVDFRSFFREFSSIQKIVNDLRVQTDAQSLENKIRIISNEIEERNTLIKAAERNIEYVKCLLHCKYRF